MWTPELTPGASLCKLAGNDANKDEIVRSGGVDLILSAATVLMTEPAVVQEVRRTRTTSTASMFLKPDLCEKLRVGMFDELHNPATCHLPPELTHGGWVARRAASSVLRSPHHRLPEIADQCGSRIECGRCGGLSGSHGDARVSARCATPSSADDPKHGGAES